MRKEKERGGSLQDFIQTLMPKPKLQFKNASQKELYRMIKDHEITICHGPAGTGKSFISVYTALRLIFDEEYPYRKLILIKPAVESDEKLGFLPGDVHEKLDPFILSIFSIIEKLFDMFGDERPNRTLGELRRERIIEPMALAYMRGMNIENSVVLFEEAQNSTKHQMKTLVTRLGEDSKLIINGDVNQSDRMKRKEDTGLWDIISRLDGIPEIGVFQFKNGDQVRNPLIEKILERYESEDL